LLKKIGAEAGIRSAHVHGLNKLFAVKKHEMCPIFGLRLAYRARSTLAPSTAMNSAGRTLRVHRRTPP
jgi:hypothetical protein